MQVDAFERPPPLPAHWQQPRDLLDGATPARAGEAQPALGEKARRSPPSPKAPLHPLQEGAVNPDCVRGWFSFPCPHHPGEHKPRPELCGRQSCESSTKDNSLERARDAWEGTADRNTRGLRHYGEIPWGILTFTLPSELRAEAQGDKLRKFRKAAGELALEILRKHSGDDRARFFCRSWLHPEGDKEPGVFKPHENVLFPLFAWHPVRWAVSHRERKRPRFFFREARAQAFAASRARPEEWTVEKVRGFKKRLNYVLPKSWLLADGWIISAWRTALLKIFGQWWEGDDPPPLSFPFYKFEQQEAGKRHALEYFGRTFPAWAGHSEVSIRPRTFDFAHWKHRVAAIGCMSGENALPPFDACRDCLEEGVDPSELPARVVGYGESPAGAEKAAAAALEEHCCALCQRERPEGPYLEHRRIMALYGGRIFAAAPETGPPPDNPSPAQQPIAPLDVTPLGGAAFEAAAARYGAYRDSFEYLVDHENEFDLVTGEVKGGALQ